MEASSSLASRANAVNFGLLLLLFGTFVSFAIISWMMVGDVTKVRKYIKSECGLQDGQYQTLSIQGNLHFINNVGIIVGSISTGCALLLLALMVYRKREHLPDVSVSFSNATQSKPMQSSTTPST